MSLNFLGRSAMVAHSQAVALVMSIMSGMKTLQNQRKAELEGF